uniref:Uncharacterized protein n=2 Tax=Biomphalaria glabrata TaxID=6526 RepID=A0A2C9K6Z9_BIOGL
MTFSWRLLYAVLSVPWFLIPVMSQIMTADEYCLSKFATKKKDQVKYGFSQFAIMCSNLDAFNECILNTTNPMQTKKALLGVRVQLFETVYPHPYDLIRAGYIFCTEELPLYLEHYKFQENDVIQCEKSINFSGCLMQGEAADNLARLIKGNSKTIMYLAACNSTYHYYTCLRSQYIKCKPEFSNLFNYHFARLGPDCLLYEYENNTLILFTKCPTQSRNAGTVSVPLGALLAIRLSLGMLGLFLYHLELSRQS